MPVERHNAHPLGNLIELVMDEQGLSDERLAERARQRRHEISKQHINALRAKPLKTLVPSTMEALADALRLPLGRVVEAALASLTWPDDFRPGKPIDWSVEAAVTADPALSPDAKNMILALLQAARSSGTNVTMPRDRPGTRPTLPDPPSSRRTPPPPPRAPRPRAAARRKKTD